jgi:formylglycine-generating enzyme required for sulfatase activity
MTYRMGSPSGEVGKSKSENTDWDGVETLRHVTLTNDFYLGVYELTRKQGITYTGYGNPGSVSGYEAYPVGGDNGRGWMSYGDMRGTTYLWPQDGHQVGGALHELRLRTGIDFDLPTEAQWEFACRAGTSTALYTGENLTGETTSANLDAIAWYSGNASNQHEVGLLQPNGFGLYDMLGNVGEFCVDRITHNALTSGAFIEPVGIESGDNHAIRGGSYAKAANHARAAHRQDYVNSGNHYGECGFRLWAPAVAK